MILPPRPWRIICLLSQAAQQERRGQVHVYHRLPVLQRKVLAGGAPLDPRRVYQHVDLTAQQVKGLAEAVPDLLRAGQVAGQAVGLPASGPVFLRQRPAPPGCAHQHHLGSRLQQALRHALAQAAGGSGKNHFLARYIKQVHSNTPRICSINHGPQAVLYSFLY